MVGYRAHGWKKVFGQPRKRCNSHFYILRYFTWDGGKFPSSVDMINGVAAKGRKVLYLCTAFV